MSLSALFETAAALAPIALAAFAGVQLVLAARDRRDRKRAAFAALQAENLRIGSLTDALAPEDLLEWVWQGALRVDDLLPRDPGSIMRLLGELGAETASLGALAYQALNDSTVRLRMLVNALERLRPHIAGPPDDSPPLRALETQVKNGLEQAAAVHDDAMRNVPHWLRLKKELRIRDPQSELGRALKRQLAGEASKGEGGKMKGPAEPWNEEEWLRVQYGFAHHDIWWVKGHQMKVGNWTLLLLAALVGFGKLMRDEPGLTPAEWQGWLFGLSGALIAFFGASYVWDLYDGLVAARKRASDIVQPLPHPVFEGVKHPELRNRRDRVFPGVVTVILFVALPLALWYFHVRWGLPVPAAMVYGTATPALLALWRWWRATHPRDNG